MKRFSLILAIATAALALSPAYAKKKTPAEESESQSLAVYLLKQLNEREQLAYEKYETAVTEADVNQVKRELQSVIDGYESLIAQAPNYAPAFVSYGLMLNRTGNRDESYAMFRKADSLDNGIPVVKNQLGNYMAEEGNYIEAYTLFLLARDLDPKESLYEYQMGSVLLAYHDQYITEGLFTASEIDRQIQSHFKQAMKKNPKDLSLKIRYAQSFFDIDNPNWEDALVVWQQLYDAAGSEYEQQMVRLYTARVRFELGHHTAARKLLKQIDHPDLQKSKSDLLASIDKKYPQ